MSSSGSVANEMAGLNGRGLETEGFAKKGRECTSIQRVLLRNFWRYTALHENQILIDTSLGDTGPAACADGTNDTGDSASKPGARGRESR